jgi:hypothetical protein
MARVYIQRLVFSGAYGPQSLRVFGKASLVDSLVWLTFALEKNPTGQPAPACFAVAIQAGEITRFESFTLPGS